LRSVFDIQRYCMDAITPICRPLKRLLASPGDYDRVTAIMEAVRQRFADTAASTRHQDRVAANLHG
jgi:hypothetical protein